MVLMDKFIEYLQQFENVNHLPDMEQINNEFVKGLDEDEGEDEEFFDFLMSEQTSFITRDGTSVKLYMGGNCVLHSFSQRKSEFDWWIYEIENGEYYVCIQCLERLKLCNDEIDKMFDSYEDTKQYLFPVKWTDSGIEAWFKKKLKRDEEYSTHRMNLEDERERVNGYDEYEEDDD